jgi:putative phosphoesterase
MKIGIFSDIHDNLDNLFRAFDIFRKERIKQAFFCGDLCSPFVAEYFKDFRIPTYAVFGNNEGDRIGIQRRIRELNLNHLKYAPAQGLMWNKKIGSRQIAVYHGHQKEILEALMSTNKFDVLLTGHSHHSHIKKAGQTLWINPGSVCGWAGIATSPADVSVATLDLNSLKPAIIKL